MGIFYFWTNQSCQLMSDFKVTILGNGSAVPTASQHPSSQIVMLANEQFMIDCGEATQMQMIKYKIKHRNLNNIFISHLHGDHYFGIFGLISTFHLFGRKESLNIYAPAELESLIAHQLRISKTNLHFKLNFHCLEDYENSPILIYNDFTVKTFPLYHRIPTWGVKIVKEDKELRIDKNFILKYNPSFEQIHSIKRGDDYIRETGEVVKNKEITLPIKPIKTYVYCSDTAYNEELINVVKNADLLYHEATFDNSMEGLAKDKYHSTSAHAATLAKESGVGQLLLGHYSARFEDLSELLMQAQVIFPKTALSEEGKSYTI